MIGGLNHNLRHDGKIYHVQTEYLSARGSKRVQTVVFADGAVVRNLMEDCEEDEQTAKLHVERAHKRAIKKILLGQLHEGSSSDTKEMARVRLSDSSPDTPKWPRSTQTAMTAAEAAPAGLSLEPPHARKVTSIHTKARIPDRVVQAREILVDLAGTAGFGGLGLFNRDGDLTTFLSSSDLDLQSIGPDYLGLFLSAREIQTGNPGGVLHTLRFDTEAHTTLVLSFEPFLRDLYETLNGVMAYVLVRLDASLPMADILSLVRHFMSLISEELLQFAPQAVSNKPGVEPSVSSQNSSSVSLEAPRK